MPLFLVVLSESQSAMNRSHPGLYMTLTLYKDESNKYLTNHWIIDTNTLV